MVKQPNPKLLAGDITRLLDELDSRGVLGASRFPVNVTKLSQDYSNDKYPNEPITKVEGAPLHGFEGALYRDNKKGWAIFYNNAVTSEGRINFTLAHEFGHYLLHRKAYPDGIECNFSYTEKFNPDHSFVESQADEFAANLLMPLNDFRKQINPDVKATFKDIKACAERYQTSLTATTLQWLSYTERRAILVASREGFILWARSSQAAYETGLYIKTVGESPIEFLSESPIYFGNAGKAICDKYQWKNEPYEKICFTSEQHDFSLSLLHYNDKIIENEYGEEIEEEDLCERMSQPRF